MLAGGGESDRVCVALLGMAETFRTAPIPKYKMAIKCVMAILEMPISPQMRTIAHFHLGKMLFFYTNNIKIGQSHLEEAYNQAQTMLGFEEIRVQLASTLADVYIRQRHFDLAKNILIGEVKTSQSFPFWHCQFYFQLANMHVQCNDPLSASSMLDAGAQFAAQCSMVYNEALFRLTKAMVVVVDANRRNELHGQLERVQHLIASLNADHPRIDHLKAFFFLLQLAYFLKMGDLKGARPCLKQLQAIVQTLSASRDSSLVSQPTQFHWISKDCLTVLTYVVTVGHAVQSGQMDRVLKYRDRALAMITKLRQMHTSPGSRNVSPHVNAILLNHFEMLLRENSSMCRIIMGQPESALNEISAMVAVMKVNGDLSSTFSAQVHTLLGFYGMMMRNPIDAEKQFKSALAAVTDTDLWTNIYLNLAILYLQSGRDEQFYSLLERITPERLQSAASTLLAAAHFVRALQSFFHSRHQEAKMFLKDCLALSNKDDMLRLSACALILLGRIFLASNSVQECVQMLGPGLDMAGKVPDLCLQTWATSMLRDVYAHHRDVNKASEFKQFADTYAGHIEKERIQASHNPAHRLLQWIDGPPSAS